MGRDRDTEGRERQGDTEGEKQRETSQESFYISTSAGRGPVMVEQHLCPLLLGLLSWASHVPA